MTLWIESIPGYLPVLLSETIFLTALAMSLNIITGSTGYLPFGLHFLFGMGGYVYAISIIKFGLPVYFALIFSGLIGLLSSSFFGFLASKIKGAYFAIATLAIAESMRYIFVNWDYVGGGYGMTLPPVFHLLDFYILSLLVLVLATLSFYLIQKNEKLRIALAAIKENEEVAKICGINVTWPKFMVMIIGGLFISMLGGVWIHYQTYITPSIAFNEMYTVIAVGACLLGGIGSFQGVLLGGLIFAIIREYSWLIFPEIFLLVLGLSLIITVHFFPNGLFHYLEQKFGKR
jgi:branched-chain amino acid transport system permease protein